MYHEDMVVGRWTTFKFSAALPATAKNNLLARVEKLRDAVKLAREEANLIDAIDVKYGKSIFDFVFDEK